MPVTEAQVAEAAVWLDAHAAAAEKIKDAAEQAATATWLSFEAWYSAAAVAAVANEMAQLSTASQDMIVGSAQGFIANVVSILKGTRTASIPRTELPPIRNGVPLTLVHTRPAHVFRRGVALGVGQDEAIALAMDRAEQLVATDMSLAERSAQWAIMRELGVTEYRRVVRPELSKTGSCGLCIVASDQVYSTSVLMPMHSNCRCRTMPIIGDVDPGLRINTEDLKRFYADAGSTSAADLKRTRYVVNEHGEYGPTLSKADDSFRGPDSVALEDDPDRAARMLVKALPVLERMETSGAAEGPLTYQRNLVARLAAIAA